MSKKILKLLQAPHPHTAQGAGIDACQFFTSRRRFPKRLSRLTQKLLAVGLLLCCGCAFTGRTLHVPLPAEIPPKVHLSVPFYPQTALRCGPAALAMALQDSGADATADQLADEVYTPGRQGSLQSDLISAARRHQRLAYPIQGFTCLLEALAAGQPVVVFQNLGLTWLPRWHFAVAVGYDVPLRQMILHTGRKADRSVGMATFHDTWQRAEQWGLLVLPPGAMPVCAQEQPYLQAALGLQQAGHPEAALACFRAAARQWPDSTEARMALGNALYACGDPGPAAEVFRQATRMDPTNGAAFNNLAHVLCELGNRREAETAARRAVDLGGPREALYRRTLEEILQAQP